MGPRERVVAGLGAEPDPGPALWRPRSPSPARLGQGLGHSPISVVVRHSADYHLNHLPCTVQWPSSSRTLHLAELRLCPQQTLLLPCPQPSNHIPLSSPWAWPSNSLTAAESPGVCLLVAGYLLSIVFSRFIHAVACVRIPFLFKSEQYSIVCIYHILFTHSSINGHYIAPMF